MASLPLDANILFLTVMATKMPLQTDLANTLIKNSGQVSLALSENGVYYSIRMDYRVR
jgi:hypothetical protein